MDWNRICFRSDGWLYWGLHGEDANKAIGLVKDQLGDNYQYFANDIHWEMGDPLTVRVLVIGYNTNEIKQVRVHWIEAKTDPNN